MNWRFAVKGIQKASRSLGDCMFTFVVSSARRHAAPRVSESVKPVGKGSLGSRPIWLIP